jgi:hypothetical protein
MLEPVLLGVVVSLAHEQGGVCHHLEQEAREGRAAEEDAACVQGLVILREEDVDVLDARGNGGGDVRGVPRELIVEDGRVTHCASCCARWLLVWGARRRRRWRDS